MSYPIFMSKPSTHHMYAQDQLFHKYGPKVFTDNQMLWIKYIYYISNVSKDSNDSLIKQNSKRLHSTTWTATGAAHRLELLIEEFQYIFSFWVAGKNSKVEYTYGWYSASAGNKWYATDNNKVKCNKVVSGIAPILLKVWSKKGSWHISTYSYKM
jgi:hypothetical protein